MNKTLLTLIGASALTVATVAAAAPAAQQGSKLSGLYVTGLAGYGKMDYKKDATLDKSFDNAGFMWSAQVGYQITPNFAVEGGYMELPVVKAESLANPDVSARLYTNVIDLMVKGIYPINNQFDVFAKAGFGRTSQSSSTAVAGASTSVSSTEHKIVPIMAIGGDYNLNEHFALTAEAITTLKSGDVKSSYGAMAGVTYKF